MDRTGEAALRALKVGVGGVDGEPASHKSHNGRLGISFGGGRETVFSLPSSGALKCLNPHLRKEIHPQKRNVHSVVGVDFKSFENSPPISSVSWRSPSVALGRSQERPALPTPSTPTFGEGATSRVPSRARKAQERN